jgi:hypothetical protein
MDLPILSPRNDYLETVEMWSPSGWWDGPVNGLARWQQQLQWFQLSSDLADQDQVYRLFALSDDERACELEHHQAFERLVGTHFCFHLPLDERIRHPSGQHSSFYQQPRPDRQDYCYDERQLGWFDHWANSLQR